MLKFLHLLFISLMITSIILSTVVISDILRYNCINGIENNIGNIFNDEGFYKSQLLITLGIGQ